MALGGGKIVTAETIYFRISTMARCGYFQVSSVMHCKQACRRSIDALDYLTAAHDAIMSLPSCVDRIKGRNLRG